MWFQTTNGQAYESDRPSGDARIPDRPGGDYVWRSRAWQQKTPVEKSEERTARVDTDLSYNQTLRALVVLIADLHGLTEKEVTEQLKGIYATL